MGNPSSNLSGAPDHAADTLNQIRQQTCYKALRSLIDLVQIIFFVIAGLLTAVSVVGGVAGIQVGGIFTLIGGLALAFLIVVLAIAGKQAALLLVDIADCQIRLAGKTS